MKYKIDIIMGIYNCEDYIEESINSILQQSFREWRLIMCDDGSTDKTFLIASKISKKYKDKMILLKNKKNMGLNYTLNKCIEYSDAKYIARMDADDSCDPQRLEKEFVFLEKNPEYTLVSCNSKLFDENGFWGKLDLVEKPTKYDFLKSSPFCHASVLIRSEDLKKVGGYSVDDRLIRVEDYHLWFKLYSCGFKGYNIQEYLYYIRDDRNAFNRRNWKNRKNEFYVRKIGYKMLHLPLHCRLYAFRPIIVGLIPKSLYKILHRGRLKEK